MLTVTEMLRKKGVVGKFVEFYGDGLSALPLADRATIANMAPEYGATCGIFPVDAETLRYLRLTGRPESLVRLVEAYYKEQHLFHTAGAPEAQYSDTISLDLATVEPSLAGPTRPQDRVRLRDAKPAFAEALKVLLSKAKPKPVAKDVKRLRAEGGAQTAVGAQNWTACPMTRSANATVRLQRSQESRRLEIMAEPNLVLLCSSVFAKSSLDPCEVFLFLIINQIASIVVPTQARDGISPMPI